MNPPFGFRNLEGRWMPSIVQKPFLPVEPVSELDDLYQKSAVARYSTFVDFPLETDLRPSITQFVDAAFVYTGHREDVRCVHCNLILSAFLPHEEPEEVHQMLVPFCPRVNFP